MTNKSTETNTGTTASAAAKPELIMYLQGPYERFPSCVHRVDGELSPPSAGNVDGFMPTLLGRPISFSGHWL
jgi:hypothetical protein